MSGGFDFKTNGFEVDGGSLPLKKGKKISSAIKNKTPRKARGHLLAYLDSNQDKQNQNLSYYHYTIGQSVLSALPVGLPPTAKRSAKISFDPKPSKII